MRVKSFRRYSKGAFEAFVPRRVTSNNWEAGCWIRHTPTKTWFEAYEEFDSEGTPMLVGFGFYHENVVVPLAECVHAYDAAQDA